MHAELKALVNSTDQQRALMGAEVKALLPRLRTQWQAHASALLGVGGGGGGGAPSPGRGGGAGGEGWEAAGALAAGALSALRELLMLLPELKGGEEEGQAASFFNEGQAAAAAIAPQLFAPGEWQAGGS